MLAAAAADAGRGDPSRKPVRSAAAAVPADADPAGARLLPRVLVGPAEESASAATAAQDPSRPSATAMLAMRQGEWVSGVTVRAS